ncbi:MAG: hypothetical protein NTZ59_11280 [Bacteroidetes bacterium]|nr:hypothetical protein [Bacteroidota bacterium]
MAYYARMSYNSNGWQTPSGAQGKSPNAGNHEYDYGFGFEEWLFNKRRYKNKEGKNCHFAYLEPLSEFDPLYQKNDDLILYTLQWEGNVCTRHIVLRLSKDDWRFIDREEYLELKEINNASILEMRRELAATMPVLSAGLVLNRFNQQKEGNNYNGNPTTENRLWNIEILKEVQPFMELVTEELPCPDWHISTFKMFRLYDSERGNFNHNNCVR